MGAEKIWDGANWQYVGGGGGTIVCTTATRPATPGIGQQIYETNTGFTLLWDGATWQTVGSGASGGSGGSGGGSTIFVSKLADKGMTNTATLANDDELFLTVPKAGTYVLDMLLIFTGPTNTQAPGAGIKIAMTLPFGATLRFHQFGPGVNTATTYDPAVDKSLTGDQSTRVVGSFGTSTDIFARYHGVLTVPASGAGEVLRLTWAPAVVHATLTTYLRPGSYLRLDAGSGGSGIYAGGGTLPVAYAARYLTGVQNIGTAGSPTVVLFDATSASPVGITYSAGEFTVPHAGLYTVAASLGWPVNTAGNARSTIINVNGVTKAQVGMPPSAQSTTGYGVECVQTLSLAAGDKVTILAYQNSGVSLALYASEAYTRVSITSVGGNAGNPLAMGKAVNSTFQTIPDSTWTRLVLPNNQWLDGGATRTTDYIVIPSTGRYAIAGYVAFQTGGTAFRRLVGIGQNWTIASPSANILGTTESTGNAAATPGCRYYEEHDLVAGDMICLLAWQNSALGPGLDTRTTTNNTMLSVRAVPTVENGTGAQTYLLLKGGSTNLASQFADAVWSNVSMPNTAYSSGTGISAAGNVVTVTQGGVYSISAGLIMGISGTLRRVLGVESFVAEALGSGTPLMRSELSGAASVYPTFALSGDVFLAAGTKIRLIGYQNQGGGTALAQRDDLMSAYFNVRKVA